jgi:FkbM family methyltransferase
MRLLQMLRRRLAGTQAEALLRSTGLGPWILGRHEARVLAKRVQSVRALGELMRFRANSRMAITRIDMFGRDEHAFLAQVLDALREGDCFYDVGANMGTVSVLVGLKLRRLGGGDVVAFEPNPLAVEETVANARLNRLEVRVMPFALGSEDGQATLAVDLDCARGTDSIVVAGASGQETREVAVRRGDAVTMELGATPTVMKIDVEGAELEVLRGFATTLRHSPLREVFVEVHPNLLATAGQSDAQVVNFMGEHGFACIWSERRGTETHRRFARTGERAA